MRKFFITGTNTGVGKTLASALLCRELASQGKKVAYVKPVQTGCFIRNGEFIAPDIEFVKLVCGNALDTFCRLKFKLAASPHLSASEEGSAIDCEKLIQDIKEFSCTKEFDFLVIEGAGGITVPLTPGFGMIDLCKAMDCGLLVVTTTQLGTLNHTKLTLDYAKSHGFDSSIIISGCSENPDVIEKDNIKLISEMVGGRVLFKIPQLDGLDTESSESIILPEISLGNF